MAKGRNNMKLKHTVSEWEVMLAAYLYEKYNNEPLLMSDASYDRVSKHLEAIGTTIPGFSSHTGQWVNSLPQAYIEVLEKARAKLLIYAKKGNTEGTHITHLILI